jgi:hypothetical protein
VYVELTMELGCPAATVGMIAPPASDDNDEEMAFMVMHRSSVEEERKESMRDQGERVERSHTSGI